MRRLILALALLSGVIVIVAVGYFTFIVGGAVTEGHAFLAFRSSTGAMEPTLGSGETFTVRSLRGPKGELLPVSRGDVIVHRRPPDTSKVFAKRVVGIPGDTLQMHQGMLRLNGRETTGTTRSTVGTGAFCRRMTSLGSRGACTGPATRTPVFAGRDSDIGSNNWAT